MVSKSVLQEQMAKQEYKYGFVSDLDEDKAPKGLNEDIVRLISRKKNEPEWFLEWRLRAYRHWLTMKEPKWSNVTYPPINYQDIIYYAGLNSAVFSDGSFAYVPPGVRCPMELSTYFRINAQDTGQFERTLIIADEGAYVSYLEGCTAPIRDTNQLHAAVVELIALDNAEIKYSTIQNWYPGDKNGKGGIYNFVTKRGKALGANSKVSWTQVETGSAITFPDIQVQEPTAQMEHEASTSKIGEEQLFYCQARGITPEDATNMIVNGFCKQVFLKLPMEFAVEAQKLIGVSLNLEGTVG